MAKGRKTGGRQPGSRNKITGELKDMILKALANKGGIAYLEAQADKNPQAFLTLVGKVLPLQVTGKDGESLAVPQSVTFIIQQQPGAVNRT